MTARAGRIGVIGGGLGGLAAACTLAARGYAVTLFEKSPWLGGKAAVLEAHGFRFDMGPTILTLPSVLERIFGEAQRTLDEYLDLIRLDPQWRCFFSDGATLDLLADVEKMCQTLHRFAPGGRVAQDYRRFLDFSARLHGISERFFFWRSIGSIWDMIDLKNLCKPQMLADVLAMRMGKSVAQAVRSHVAEPRVAQMLDHFTQYVGSAPDASPAVLCSIAHMQTQEGVWYPRGGTAAVPQALTRLAEELGVELRTGVGVRRLLLDGNSVAGVETEAGEQVPLAAVVSNADSVRTYRELLAGTRAAQRFEKRRGYEPACSGVVLYLGLDRAYDQLLHHNFVFSRDPHEEFEDIYRRGRPALDPTCYVCAPARTEPGVAPAGGEALYVLVHTPYLRPGQDWQQMFPAYRRTILSKLADTAGLSDLEPRIRFEDRLTPLDIHNRYRVLNGAIYGLASHGRYFGAFKPGNRSKDVKGLYLAGGAAHPGPGMPMVLMSGWIAADTLDGDGVVQRNATNRRQFSCRSVRPTPPPNPLPEAGRGSKKPLPASGRGWGGVGRRNWLLQLFRRWGKRYLRKNFHAVRLARECKPVDPAGEPVLVVANHPSWWDPLVGLMLLDLFPDRLHSAPIDAAALGKYRFFEWLGFFGVERGTMRGARDFLRTSLAVLARPDACLWVPAQGRFSDPRERPIRLRPGIGHLVRRMKGGTILPLALEYPFWGERYPEALARFGVPIPINDGSRHSALEWVARIESALTATMDALALDAMQRHVAAFDTLVGGNVGVGGLYDLWRRLRAWIHGKPFRPEHGEPETPPALGGVS